MVTKKICVYGVVQGIGFRPFISRLASEYSLKGIVANKGAYVEIYVQGTEDKLIAFRNDLENKRPIRSIISTITEENIEMNMFRDFQIVSSSNESGDVYISPDIAICDDCKRELYDPNNHRYQHPFINCTLCGPRLTILDGVPYDRKKTSMKSFSMCENCLEEYQSSSNRRYHAQPVCCNNCGPKIYAIIGCKKKVKKIEGNKSISITREIIANGGIAAIKGIGGFHLCCDANNNATIERLRKKKNRITKPFAVMARDIDSAREIAIIPSKIEKILDSPEKPIVLLQKKNETMLSKYVAPGNNKIGLMLPYAPIQLLLFKYNDNLKHFPNVLVMTSANLSGSPLCTTDEEVIQELGDICDVFLSNDREIRIQVDDSVINIYQNTPYMVRRSRGFVPLPIQITSNLKGTVLAIGGQLKNTICLGKDQLYYPSMHIGEMGNVKTAITWQKTVRKMKELLNISPQIIACDLHPGYFTKELLKEFEIELYPVQHHFAHILSCMAENNYDGQVIGVAFDGTGYGTDKTIWGGEFLEVTYSNFQRKGSIVPFVQVGGEAAVKEGYRIALSIIESLYPNNAAEIVHKLGLCDEALRSVYQKMQHQNINCVKSTSMGRLFDAASAILGIKKSSSFEGESAIALQVAGEKCLGNTEFDFHLGNRIYLNDSDERFWIATDHLMRILIEEKIRGHYSIEQLAYLFHNEIATLVVEGCKKIRDDSGINVCALSGGVFQNLLLLSLCEEKLTKENFKVLKHKWIPSNDGGISLGQAVAAMAHLSNIEK